MSDWIYAEGQDADHKTLKAKLKELEDIVKPILKRKTDAVERPDAIKAYESNLADVKTAIDLVKAQIKEQETAISKSAEAASKASASSTQSPSSASTDSFDDLEEDAHSSSSTSTVSVEPTEVPIIYTEKDLTFIQETHSNGSKWLAEQQAAQKKLKDSDDPAVSVKDIKAQGDKLNDAVVQIMMKKARHYNYKPKQEKKPKAPKKPKKDKKAKKDDKGPSQAELEEALEKAGLKKDSIKFANFDHPDEILDKDGKLRTKLELEPDASEDQINEAIRKIVDARAKEGGKEDAKVKGSPDHNEL